MGSYKFDPATGIENVLRQIRNAGEELSMGFNVETSAFKPKIDITESNDVFKVFAELPGIDKSKVSISVNEDHVLNIKGNKDKELPEGRSLLISERKYGEFTRSLQLPEEADIEKIAANFQNGVLELTIPKKEPVQPKVIEVKLD